MNERWWAPSGPHVGPDAFDQALLAEGERPELDIGQALLALHRVGAAACEAVANIPLADPPTLIRTLAEARAVLAPDLVTSVAKSSGDTTTTDLNLAALIDSAELGALRVFTASIAKGCAPSQAAKRCGAIYGLPAGLAGLFIAKCADPKTQQPIIESVADRLLMDYVAAISPLLMGDPVSKAGDEWQQEARDESGRWTSTGVRSKPKIQTDPTDLSYLLQPEPTAVEKPVEAPVETPTAAPSKPRSRVRATRRSRVRASTRTKTQAGVQTEARNLTRNLTRNITRNKVHRALERAGILRAPGFKPLPMPDDVSGDAAAFNPNVRPGTWVKSPQTLAIDLSTDAYFELAHAQPDFNGDLYFRPWWIDKHLGEEAKYSLDYAPAEQRTNTMTDVAQFDSIDDYLRHADTVDLNNTIAVRIDDNSAESKITEASLRMQCDEEGNHDPSRMPWYYPSMTNPDDTYLVLDPAELEDGARNQYQIRLTGALVAPSFVENGEPAQVFPNQLFKQVGSDSPEDVVTEKRWDPVSQTMITIKHYESQDEYESSLTPGSVVDKAEEPWVADEARDESGKWTVGTKSRLAPTADLSYLLPSTQTEPAAAEPDTQAVPTARARSRVRARSRGRVRQSPAKTTVQTSTQDLTRNLTRSVSRTATRSVTRTELERKVMHGFDQTDSEFPPLPGLHDTTKYVLLDPHEYEEMLNGYKKAQHFLDTPPITLKFSGSDESGDAFRPFNQVSGLEIPLVAASRVQEYHDDHLYRTGGTYDKKRIYTYSSEHHQEVGNLASDIREEMLADKSLTLAQVVNVSPWDKSTGKPAWHRSGEVDADQVRAEVHFYRFKMPPLALVEMPTDELGQVHFNPSKPFQVVFGGANEAHQLSGDTSATQGNLGIMANAKIMRFRLIQDPTMKPNPYRKHDPANQVDWDDEGLPVQAPDFRTPDFYYDDGVDYGPT
jgi:hypothetical protein